MNILFINSITYNIVILTNEFSLVKMNPESCLASSVPASSANTLQTVQLKKKVMQIIP